MDVKKILGEYAHGGLLQIVSSVAAGMLDDACEIRIRTNLPLLVRTSHGEFFISARGARVDGAKDAYLPTMRDVVGTLDKMASHSLYAFDSEIKNGFITLPGGHRVGISGRAAIEGGRIKTLRHINGLCLRISRQVLGAGEKFLPYIKGNTLLVSPPGQGKTTVLRDAIRLLSNSGKHISVVDERSEIAGSHLGAAQNDLGIRTDVLDGAPKAEGMLLMLRAMTPDIIAVDEIGREDDVRALMDVACCGARILATLHGASIHDLRKKPVLAPILENKIFNRYIFLTNKPRPGTMLAVYDENLQEVAGA
ncbi:MAG: stage III sporulation protein AA [Defluviitaleaceae bacterium]|nr:stage III sporulation protein AA [Defluviitaleaceae bacterium]